MKIISIVITKPYNHELVKKEASLEINLEIHVPTHALACITPLIISLKPKDAAMYTLMYYWKVQMFI